MLLLDLPSLPSSFPALDLSGLLLFAVFSLWLTLNCANTIPSLLVRVFLHCWILLLGHNFGLFPTGRFQLVLGMLLLRLPLCDFLEFPVFRCSNFLLVLVLLGTALARQIPFLTLFPFPSNPTRPLFFPSLLSLSLFPFSRLSGTVRWLWNSRPGNADRLPKTRHHPGSPAVMVPPPLWATVRDPWSS